MGWDPPAGELPVAGRRRYARTVPDPHVAAPDRHGAMPYRRCGRRGLKLPAISLRPWQNVGDDRPVATQRAVARRAFDRGVTHVDPANNYGPPYGSVEVDLGRILREDLAPYRDELVISTKAGWALWPGPYGDGGSRQYLPASLARSLDQSLARSLDQSLAQSLARSLARMGLHHVDVFYHHRFDHETSLEETTGALDAAVRQGKARYVGVSSCSEVRTRQAVAVQRDRGTPLVVHQPPYSMLNRCVEGGLLDVLASRELTAEELVGIDRFAVEGGIDLWRGPSTG